jgi:menaquinone-dependent protoporphyrinogen oxidase
MATLLMAYVTRGGQTLKIARRMAALLEARGHTIRFCDLDGSGPEPELDGVQGVLLGAPIYAGRYPRSAARFARAHRELLARVPSAFFSVSLGVASKVRDGRAQVQPLVKQFLERAEWRPDHVELIAGALLYTKYNVLKRFLMRRISRSEGGDTDTSRDYEYTDWAAVERFAERIALEVEAAPATRRSQGSQGSPSNRASNAA